MMYGSDKKRSPRNVVLFLDILHIVVGILVTVCAVLAFLDPERNRFLFPVIFLLAALLNGVNGWHKKKESGRDMKKKVGAIVLCVIAGILFLIGVISALSIWR